MAKPDVIAPLISALEKAGVTLLDEDKAKIEAFVEPLADNDANAVITAIAAHIEMNGIGGMVAPAIRNALTGSEPAIDAVINSNVSGGFDSLETLLNKLAT